MKLAALHLNALRGDVAALDLISLEGGTYILEARVLGGRLSIRDEQGRILHFRSVEHARDFLHDFPRVPFHLVHAEIHDEMIGMPVVAHEPLRVPISLRSSW
ncbi:DUF6482 family protein [Pseudomonas sp. N040]|uniref:DUF6482 family protein n=1 Tax=Pseudomonas sp. N040 TaxID=2785325 RepID=UPI0018A25D3B|nr:DUF6482 family protein [Pseudomonas sp. N040]MBF7730222.1 cation transporter [Pseudomonas sp. N040]MBW7013864.1 cation transporter [Pseudomonas sp. N040]